MFAFVVAKQKQMVVSKDGEEERQHQECQVVAGVGVPEARLVRFEAYVSVPVLVLLVLVVRLPWELKNKRGNGI